MSERISTVTKIKILLEGELKHMNTEEVESWFIEAFQWVDSTERYKLGVRLRDAKDRWKLQLEEHVSNENITK